VAAAIVTVTVVRRPLVLTGGPAVGKSSCARLLASTRLQAAVIEVDDIRQLVFSGGVAPWKGSEGRRQQHLGVDNACALTRRFLQAGIEVVLTDVLTPDTLSHYRHLVPDVVVVHLHVLLPEAQRRAATRVVHLTEDEFVALHEADRSTQLATDHSLDVTSMTLEEQASAIAQLWVDAGANG
jgi:predicted kinase